MSSIASSVDTPAFASAGLADRARGGRRQVHLHATRFQAPFLRAERPPILHVPGSPNHRLVNDGVRTACRSAQVGVHQRPGDGEQPGSFNDACIRVVVGIRDGDTERRGERRVRYSHAQIPRMGGRFGLSSRTSTLVSW